MNATEMKNAARNSTISVIMPALQSVDAIQFGDASWAILQEIDGQEIWCEVTVKTKAYTDTQRSPAFDPFVAAEDWKTEKEMKAEKAAEKQEKKEKKIAADKAKREKKKEQEAE